MNYRRKKLGWLNELAWRRFLAGKWRQFGEEAPDLSLSEFSRRGHALVKEKRDREHGDIDFIGMEPLRRRLLWEKELNTTLREHAFEPKGDGQFEYELHWYRVINMLDSILNSAAYGAEEGHDRRRQYQLDSQSMFSELDQALILIDQHTDQELFQMVHKLQGRANLAD